MLHIISHQGNEIKTTVSTATCLLERPESGTLTLPNAGNNMEQEELSFIAGGNAKWYSHFGKESGSFPQN
nr:hypothetical protein [Streptococcus oralis]